MSYDMIKERYQELLVVAKQVQKRKFEDLETECGCYCSFYVRFDEKLKALLKQTRKTTRCEFCGYFFYNQWDDNFSVKRHQLIKHGRIAECLERSTQVISAQTVTNSSLNQNE